MKKLHFQLALLFTAQVLLFTSCQPKCEISNPYASVDWENHEVYKANLHTHTSRKGGKHSPQDVVDSYHKLGYKILSITDHDFVTYPWESFSEMTASQESFEMVQNSELLPEALDYENRSPDELNMFAIQGNEVSSPHHIGSFFSDYEDRSRDEKETMEKIAKKNGLVIFNHPGRYTLKNPEKYNINWYVDFFKQYEFITGLEVYNQGDRYSNDRILWDSILVKTMPQRPVWGYSNDDFHDGVRKLGRNWNLFILPELSESAIRTGMKKGNFLYVYAIEGHSGPKTPEIKSITTNNRKGIIKIECIGQDSIRWISAGNIIARGSELILSNVSDISTYVRAEIFGPGSVTGTQPFGIKRDQ